MKKFNVWNVSTVTLLLIALLSLPLVGCAEEKGPMEKAGEKIDDAVEEAKDGVEDVGEEIGDAVEDIGEEVEDATDGGAGSQ